MKKTDQRGFAILPLLFIIVAIVAAAGIGYAISTQTDLFLSKGDDTNIVACTEEAKVCPDGSAVGRTGPNCAFADCPTVNTNATTNVNTAVNTNTAVSPTADWKTYENTTIGYTVKYPPTWKVSVCEGSTAVSFGLQGLICDSDASSEDFGIAEIIDSISVSSRVASLKDAMVSPIESQVTVSGIQGTRIAGVHKKDLNTLYGGGQYSDDIFFMRNGKTYRLGYFILGGEKKYVSEFDGFYKTFTFSNPTADWKTYTNTKYGFSIKYPSTWVKEEVASTSLDGKPLIFTQLSDSLDKDGAIVISYLNSPSLFQDGKWDPSTGQITSVGGRATTSTVYTPDLSSPWAVKPTPKEKIVFAVEPSGWVNRGTTKDVNGNTYEWGNGDIQLLSGTTGKFDVLNTILSTFTFTK